mmetsp:Transcript_34700/g.68526  ORF Transcript_34700/g.68526 Transcript_34700/m.68526 type:complete len:81 (+) Transcript_34700:195-437(+)
MDLGLGLFVMRFAVRTARFEYENRMTVGQSSSGRLVVRSGLDSGECSDGGVYLGAWKGVPSPPEETGGRMDGWIWVWVSL